MGKHKKSREKDAAESFGEYEECIRRAPLTSVVGALAFGYFLQFLPLRAIVTGLLRTAVWLLKPALLVFGLLKLTNCLTGCCSRKD